MQVGQGLWLLAWRPQPGALSQLHWQLRLPWELTASLEGGPFTANSQSSSPPELSRAGGAMSEGGSEEPHNKSCQGCGARPGMKQLLQQVGSGGGTDDMGFPWACSWEAGPAALTCPVSPGSAETHQGRGGGGHQAQPGGPAALPTQPHSPFSEGSTFQPSASRAAQSPSKTGAGSTATAAWTCSGLRVEGLSLGTLLFPRRSWSSGCGQQPSRPPGAPAPA